VAGHLDGPGAPARADPDNQRRLMCLSMFWHFLDVIWIGVFTFVYLMGAMR
jgi:cytochrome o ubiquinol oxidase subunit 3